MKRLFVALALLLCSAVANAQDSMVSDLPEITSPASTDILLMTINPATSPDSRKVTVGNLFASQGITYDPNKNGGHYYEGVTSGGIAFVAADAAGTALTYVFPTTRPSSGIWIDNGTTTCPTNLPTGFPSTCHALSWGSPSGNTSTFATTNGTLTNGNCVKIDANGNLEDAGAGCAGGASVKPIYIPVSAMSTTGTCAATPINEEQIVTNGPKRWTLTPADDSSCTIWADIVMPSTWNASTVTVQLNAFSVVNDNGKYLAVDFATQCVRDGDAVSSTFGTSQPASVVFGNQTNDEEISSATSAITASGTCAAGAHLYLKGTINSGTTDSTVASNRILGVTINATY